jgi:hypothetical protein
VSSSSRLADSGDWIERGGERRAGQEPPIPQGEMTDEEVRLIGRSLADFQPDWQHHMGFGNADLAGKLSFRPLNVPSHLH